MKKQIFVTILTLTVATLAITKPASATTAVAGGSAVIKNEVLGFGRKDPRVKKLETYLSKHNSPMAPYANNLIESADHYQLDWKLVPAIAGVESTFGKNIPFNSYNAYGWNNGHYRFKSWPQSIDYVSSYFKEKYVDRGLDTPFKIGPVYAPPSRSWAGKVLYFMNQIECFENESCPDNFSLTI